MLEKEERGCAPGLVGQCPQGLRALCRQARVKAVRQSGRANRSSGSLLALDQNPLRSAEARSGGGLGGCAEGDPRHS